MRVCPPAPKIEETTGFGGDTDLFQLKSFGEGLANLVSLADDPLVIAFDGPWGSGKTVFLKQWTGLLRAQGFPTIYFDAFENDYIGDAFAALVREVIRISNDAKGQNKVVVDEFKKKAVAVGKLLLTGGARLAVRGAVRAVSAGLLSTQDISDVTAETLVDAGDESSDIAGKLLEDLFAEPNKQAEAIETFKTALAELPSLLGEENAEGKTKPLIFIIDELDRCKPPFALEILERIKHFLAVPHIHFVLGVHLAQLANSVRAAYGAGIDAETYLQKFINFKVIHSDVGDDQSTKSVTRYIEHLKRALGVRPQDEEAMQAAGDFIQHVAMKNNLSLRTVERIFSQLAVSLALTSDRTLRLGPIVGGLCVLKLLEPALYEKAKQGKLKYEEVVGIFGFETAADTQQVHGVAWAKGWWQYCLEEELSDELKDYGRSLFNYSIGSRRSIVPLLARRVVDKLAGAQ